MILPDRVTEFVDRDVNALQRATVRKSPLQRMQSRSQRLTLLGSAAAVACWVWAIWTRPAVNVEKIPVSSSVNSPRGKVEALPLTSFDAPLWYIPPAPPTPAVIASPVVAPPPPPLSLQVLGIMRPSVSQAARASDAFPITAAENSREFRAILYDPDRDRVWTADVGKTIAGFVVKAIDDRGVDLDDGSGPRRVVLVAARSTQVAVPQPMLRSVR